MLIPRTQRFTVVHSLKTSSLLRLIASTCFEHLFAHHQEALYINNWCILCVLCRLAASWVGVEPVPIQHVEAVNRNKLKANSASCWSCYTDIQCVRKVTVHLGYGM
jgi:hypothetical protein